MKINTGLKWRRTSRKKTFELNGAEAVLELSNGKIVLFQICIYDTKSNKKTMCKKCKVWLYMLIGYSHEIYNYEKSKHVRIGKHLTLKEAKVAAQEISYLIHHSKEI